MKIFRSKKNGLLYTIAFHARWTQSYFATPYNHTTKIGNKNGVKLEDFEVVAER